MGLLTNPADFTASTLTSTALNTFKNTLFTWAGTTVNGQGSISDANIDTAAAIQRTKIADTAVVAGNSTSPGTQTVTRPTTFTGNTGIHTANIASNSETVASASSIALDPTYLYHKITGTTTIGTITGASSEGQVAILIIQGALTLTHTGTDTANSIKIAGVSGSAPANYVATGASALVNHFVKLVYTKLDGAYTNFQWVQVPT